MRRTCSHLPRCSPQNRKPNLSIPAPRHLSSLAFNQQDIATILATDPGKEDSLQPTRVVGTVRTIRNQKRRSFVELGDGSTSRSLQALLEPHQAEGQVLLPCCGTGARAKELVEWVPALLLH